MRNALMIHARDCGRGLGLHGASLRPCYVCGGSKSPKYTAGDRPSLKSLDTKIRPCAGSSGALLFVTDQIRCRSRESGARAPMSKRARATSRAAWWGRCGKDSLILTPRVHDGTIRLVLERAAQRERGPHGSSQVRMCNPSHTSLAAKGAKPRGSGSAPLTFRSQSAFLLVRRAYCLASADIGNAPVVYAHGVHSARSVEHRVGYDVGEQMVETAD
jgi:hypothetical protein